MRKYIFLLLAFFLSINSYSIESRPSVNVTPNSTSNRNMNELGKVTEPSQNSSGTTAVGTSGSTGSSSGPIKITPAPSCKTYEGRIFDPGQPGYKDCIRLIKNNPSDKPIP
jgi:hypothetical protein